MQITIDSSEPLDHVLQVIGAAYGVRLSVEQERVGSPPPPSGHERTRHDSVK